MPYTIYHVPYIIPYRIIPCHTISAQILTLCTNLGE